MPAVVSNDIPIPAPRKLLEGGVDNAVFLDHPKSQKTNSLFVGYRQQAHQPLAHNRNGAEFFHLSYPVCFLVIGHWCFLKSLKSQHSLLTPSSFAFN